MKEERIIARLTTEAFSKLNRGGPLSTRKGKRGYDRKKAKAEDRRRKS